MSEHPDEDAFEETVDDVDAPVDEVLDEVPADEVPADEVPADEVPADEVPAAEQFAARPAETGHPAVDEVLRSLEGLDGRPVDEHVAAFEQAHDQLRRALSDAGDDGA
jgi:hypothetical protein